MTNIDENALIRRYQELGDLDAREQLVKQMMPMVRRIAMRYANRGQDLDDLVQVGSVGLVKAIERFDLERRVRLSTFAEPNISGEIKRHFRDHGWTVRPPRDLQELNAKVIRAIDGLAVRLERSPTIDELSSETGASREEVLEAIHAGAGYESASLSPGDQGEELHEALSVDEAGYERSDLRAAIKGGLSMLDERERSVVHLRFFEGLTQREIADRIGVSQMQVSRILRGSLKKLASELNEDIAL